MMIKPIRLLYAEDNRSDADLTKRHFARQAPEFQLEIIDTGEKCLELIQKKAFDILMLDYHLPDMGGVDILRKLIGKGFSLPVVMVTGVGDEELVVQSLRAGASDYVPKSKNYLTTLPSVLKNVLAEYKHKKRTGIEIGLTQRHILYIENNQMDIDHTLKYLAEATPHFTTKVVQTSKEALHLLNTNHNFDLVLTDLRIPDMNALELLREIKHLGVNIPFIVITGKGDEGTAVATLKLGASDYIVKRDNYLIQLPYAIENALARYQLDVVNYKLLGLNRAMKMLSECNQTLVRAKEESEFLHDICRHIIQIGGYRLAWVGFAEQDRRKTVRPVVQAGFEEGYLDTAKMTWADTKQGRSPTGTAIRIGKPSVCKNILTDPAYAPWRKEAVQRGYASSVALPLICKGRPFGALNIYSAEPNAFNRQEVKLLTELANDVAYGVTTLRTRTEHEQAEEALRESEKRYRTLFEAAGDAIFIMMDDRFIQCNQKTLELFQCTHDQIIGHTPYEFSPARQPDGKDSTQKALEKIKSALNGQPQFFEWRHTRYDGTPFEAEVQLNLVKLSQGIYIQAIVRDITERKQAEAALKESEEIFFKTFHSNPAGMVITRLEDGKCIQINDSFTRSTGYIPAESIGRTSVKLGFWTDADERKKVTQILQEQNGFRDLEFHYHNKSGEERFGLFSAEIIEIKGETCIITAMQDITERKKSDEVLKESKNRLQVLSRRLLEVQESERRTIARELHDEIGQILTALKINLQTVPAQNDAAVVQKQLKESVHLVEQALQQVRNLSLDLRPSILDDLGLIPALRWYLDRQSQRTGIAVDLSAKELKTSLPPELEIVCFRIIQEALTNVARHSKARQVRIELSEVKKKFRMVVRDNGVGFDVDAAHKRATMGTSLGLLGMEERVQLAGGKIEIQSQPGKGTEIQVHFPLSKNKHSVQKSKGKDKS